MFGPNRDGTLCLEDSLMIGRLGVALSLQILDGFTWTTMEEDSIRWRHRSDGVLSVNRLYIKEVKELKGGKIGPWNQIENQGTCHIPILDCNWRRRILGVLRQASFISFIAYA